MKIAARFTLLLSLLLIGTVTVTAGPIPSSLAETLEKRLFPESQYHLTHIQDFHEQMGPQINLSEIVRRLERRAAQHGRALVVAVEGASGEVDIDSLKKLANANNREAVAVGLLKAGYLFGEEYAALSSEIGRIRLVGVDDPRLYQKNVLAKETARYADVVKTDINLLQKQLRALSEHSFNKTLIQLEKARVQFSGGELTLGQYVEFLSRQDPGLVKSYPSLVAALDLYQTEQSLNFGEIDREREMVLRLARKQKNPNVWSRMMENAIGFRDGHMSALEYYETLRPLMTVSCPNMERYLSYLKKAESLLTDPAFRDVALVADTLARMQMKHAVTKTLYRTLCWVETQAHFYSLNLTAAEWSEQKTVSFEESQRSLKAARDFVSEQNADIGLPSLIVAATPKNYHTAYNKAQRFYELAEERNEALRKNLERVIKMESSHSDVVFIAGGFHTAALARFWKMKKMNYTILRPQIQARVVLPEGIPYPAYVKAEPSARSEQYLRTQGGLFAEGGLEFVRRLLLDVSHRISDRMWPKKLGSERFSSRNQWWSATFKWMWRWASMGVPGLRLFEQNEVAPTYVGTTVKNLVSTFGEQSNILSQKLDALFTATTPISDKTLLVIDVDSFGPNELEGQGAAWLRLVSALRGEVIRSGQVRADVVLYSHMAQPKIQALLTQPQFSFSDITFRFVQVKTDPSLKNLMIASGVDGSQIPEDHIFHLSHTSRALEGAGAVLVSGVPHLALATFAYAHFKDASFVLNELVRLFEHLTPLTMSGKLTSQILATLLAQLSA